MPSKSHGAQTRLKDAVSLLLAERLAHVRQHEAALSRGRPGEEPVHQMRVAIRRLRVALALMDRDGHLEMFLLDLKHLQDALGQVRDAHVQARWAARAGAPALKTALGVTRSRSSERELKAALKHFIQFAPALAEAIHELEPRGRLGGKYMRRKLRGRLERVGKALRPLRSDVDAADAHALQSREEAALPGGAAR